MTISVDVQIARMNYQVPSSKLCWVHLNLLEILTLNLNLLIYAIYR